MGVMPTKGFFKPAAPSKFLDMAFERYMPLTFPHGVSSKQRASTGSITSLSVSVSDLDDSHPTISTDESYSLSIEQDVAELKAETVYGALRGLETFSQLVAFDFDTESYAISDGPWNITDAPRFPHRGCAALVELCDPTTPL